MPKELWSVDALRPYLDAAMANDLPPGKTNALVAFVARDTDGGWVAEFRYVRRVGEGWKVGALAKRERRVDERYGWGAGAYVVGSW